MIRFGGRCSCFLLVDQPYVCVGRGGGSVGACIYIYIYAHTPLSFNQSKGDRHTHWVPHYLFQPHSSAAPMPLAGGRVSLPPNHLDASPGLLFGEHSGMRMYECVAV